MSSPPIVALVGGSLSGNKGAASMVLAVADGVRAEAPTAIFRVFSPYPREDHARAEGLEVHDFRPSDMILRVLPAALLTLLTGRKWKPRSGPAGALAGSDVVADVSGISFMDNRGFMTLMYNILIVLLPWALGIPTVKVAQALGPFRSAPNRIAAKMVLPRLEWVGLRGAETANYFRELGLVNGDLAADVAFLLRAHPSSEVETASPLPGDRTVTLVAPSAVLEEACRAYSIDYADMMSALIDRLQGSGHKVALIAHSAREGKEGGHTNDLPIVRRIAAQSRAELVDAELDARQLRVMIGGARLLVTSRFHAMVSGLATSTPTFVVGWSHKYGEVLTEFGLEEWAVDFRELDVEDLVAAIHRLDESADSVRAIMESRLPAVSESARLSIVHLLAAMGS